MKRQSRHLDSPEAIEVRARLRELKRATPKRLVEVSGRPMSFVGRGLNILLAHGIVDIDTSTGEYSFVRDSS